MNMTFQAIEFDNAHEALQYFATYLQRLHGADLRRIREDIETLIEFARSEKWPAEELRFLQSFLHDFGVGEGDRVQ